MKSVGFIGLKGGVGRTMLASQISVRATQNFSMVGMIDLDPTAGGASTWFRDRDDNDMGDRPALLTNVSDPVDALQRAEQAGYEFVCVDGAPGTTTATEIVAGLVDVAIIPARCSTDDLERAAMATRICQDAGVPIIGVVNDVPLKSDRRKYETEMAEQVVGAFSGAGVPVYVVRHRDQFLKARNLGAGVHEMTGRGATDPRQEIEMIYQAIVGALGYGSAEAAQ